MKQTALWYIYSTLGKGVHDVLGVGETESVLETPQANNSTLSDTFMDEFLNKKANIEFFNPEIFCDQKLEGKQLLKCITFMTSLKCLHTFLIRSIFDIGLNE